MTPSNGGPFGFGILGGQEMGMNERSRCVAVGVALARRFPDATVQFSVNVSGLVAMEDLVVPASELALNAGIEDQPLLAWAVKDGRAGIVIVDRGGDCKFYSGTPSEVLPIELRSRM